MSDPLSKFIIGPIVSDGSAAADVAGGGRPPIRPGQTPGQMVREARDHARINLEELSSSLRLPLATLDALERDDFTVLSQPVYVRGYYRRCARMLGLDENDLLLAYDKLMPPVPAVPKQRYVLGEDDQSSSRLPIRGILLTLAIVVVLVVAVMTWMRHAETASSRQDEATSAASATEPASPEPGAAVPPPSATAVTVPPRATVYDSMASAESGASTDKPVADKPSAAIVRPPGAPRPATATSTAEAPLAEGHTLLLVVRNTSWLRIEDGADKLLYAGTIHGGSRQELNGKPPYQLFIGNAAGVDVEYGGEPVDIKPYIRENATARVTVPLPAAATPSGGPALTSTIGAAARPPNS